jgi:hypothetical protein
MNGLGAPKRLPAAHFALPVKQVTLAKKMVDFGRTIWRPLMTARSLYVPAGALGVSIRGSVLLRADEVTG